MKDLDKEVYRSVGIAASILVVLLLGICLKLGGFGSLNPYVVIFGVQLVVFIVIILFGHMVMRRYEHTMLNKARQAFNRLGRLGNDTAEYIEKDVSNYSGTFTLKDKNFRLDIICQLEADFSPSARMFIIETSGERYLLLLSDRISTLRNSYFRLVDDNWKGCHRTPSQPYDAGKLVKTLRKLYGSVDSGEETVPDTYFAVVEYEKVQSTGQRSMAEHDVIFIGTCTGSLLKP